MLIIFPFLYHCSLNSTIVPQVVFFITSVFKKWITEKPSPPFVGYRVIVLPPPSMSVSKPKNCLYEIGEETLKNALIPKNSMNFGIIILKLSMFFGIYVIFSYHLVLLSIRLQLLRVCIPIVICNSFLVFFLFESLLIWLQIRFHVYYSTSLFAKVRCVKNWETKTFYQAFISLFAIQLTYK